MTEPPRYCAVCGRTLALDDALLVWDRREPWRKWHVCRPSLAGCFAAVGPADRFGIADAAHPPRLAFDREETA